MTTTAVKAAALPTATEAAPDVEAEPAASGAGVAAPSDGGVSDGPVPAVSSVEGVSPDSVGAVAPSSAGGGVPPVVESGFMAVEFIAAFGSAFGSTVEAFGSAFGSAGGVPPVAGVSPVPPVAGAGVPPATGVVPPAVGGVPPAAGGVPPVVVVVVVAGPASCPLAMATMRAAATKPKTFMVYLEVSEWRVGGSSCWAVAGKCENEEEAGGRGDQHALTAAAAASIRCPEQSGPSGGRFASLACATDERAYDTKKERHSRSSPGGPTRDEHTIDRTRTHSERKRWKGDAFLRPASLGP